CENCGGGDLEQLWHGSFTARTRSGRYLFDTNDVVCRHCGFVFVSPVYDEADLAGYYADSFGAFEGALPDYDIEKRLTFLRSVEPNDVMFVEIGANRLSEFHFHLKNIFEKVVTVDLNDSVRADLGSLETLPDECADVVAHYFVLEH